MRLQWSRAGLDGTLPGTRLRMSRAGFTGTAVATVSLVVDVTDPSQTEPMTDVQIVATPTGGSATPDSYNWRRVSGAQVNLQTSGNICDLRAPGSLNGTTLVVGCSAVVSGVSGPEATITLVCLPHIGLWSVDRATGVATPIGRPVLVGEYTPEAFLLDQGRLDVDFFGS